MLKRSQDSCLKSACSFHRTRTPVALFIVLSNILLEPFSLTKRHSKIEKTYVLHYAYHQILQDIEPDFHDAVLL